MQPESSLDKRIVLVTGAKGGLGTSITHTLLKTGATVIGASRSITAEDFPEANFVPLPADLRVPTPQLSLLQLVSVVSTCWFMSSEDSREVKRLPKLTTKRGNKCVI